MVEGTGGGEEWGHEGGFEGSLGELWRREESWRAEEGGGD